jgi:hypothetical protein
MIHINGIEYDHIAITNSEDELLGMITSEGEVIENDGIKILFAER